MKKIFFVLLIAIFIVSCSRLENPVDEKSNSITSSITKEAQEKDFIKKEFTEGDLVYFPNLKATDPEGKEITYYFSNPLNSSGQWQTKEGNAGKYSINITASDGTLNATQEILLIINKKNHPPTIELTKNYTNAKEGEVLNIDAKVIDLDNDSVSLSVSGFMTTPLKQLSYDDAGWHEVTLTADDGKVKTARKIVINVENVNRAPVIEQLSELKLKEGDFVLINPVVNDPDGDKITVSFSKPLNSNGQWQTKEGNAGEYLVNITASDGNLTSTSIASIIVEAVNKAPIIALKDKTVKIKEGETATLTFNATDAENDKIEIIISGWMNANTKQTGFDEQGVHEVFITAKDSTHETTEKVIIEVEDVNRPPVFEDGSFV